MCISLGDPQTLLYHFYYFCLSLGHQTACFLRAVAAALSPDTAPRSCVVTGVWTGPKPRDCRTQPARPGDNGCFLSSPLSLKDKNQGELIPPVLRFTVTYLREKGE